MTNVEFQEKLNEMFAKHPIIAKSPIPLLNELVYILRVEGDVDYQVCTDEGMCIPSVRKAFVPVKWLVRKVIEIEYEEEECEGTTIPLVMVTLDGDDED